MRRATMSPNDCAPPCAIKKAPHRKICSLQYDRATTWETVRGQTHIDGQVLGQGELGKQQIARKGPCEPTDVEDRREGRVLASIQLEVVPDTKQGGI